MKPTPHHSTNNQTKENNIIIKYPPTWYFILLLSMKPSVCNSKLLQIIETESSPKHIKSSNQKQYIQISLWCLLSYILEHVVSLEINETHSSQNHVKLKTTAQLYN